jgi:hypothetical protein
MCMQRNGYSFTVFFRWTRFLLIWLVKTATEYVEDVGTHGQLRSTLLLAVDSEDKYHHHRSCVTLTLKLLWPNTQISKQNKLQIHRILNIVSKSIIWTNSSWFLGVACQCQNCFFKYRLAFWAVLTGDLVHKINRAVNLDRIHIFQFDQIFIIANYDWEPDWLMTMMQHSQYILIIMAVPFMELTIRKCGHSLWQNTIDNLLKTLGTYDYVTTLYATIISYRILVPPPPPPQGSTRYDAVS